MTARTGRRSCRHRFAVVGVAALVALAARADPEALAAGQTANDRREHVEALRLFEKAYRSFEASVGPRHADTIASMVWLARANRSLGRLAEALPWSERAAAMRAEILGERDPATLESLGELGSLYGLLGRRAEQVAVNEKVLRLRTEVLGPRHRATLSAMNNLALGYSALGRHAEALAVTSGAVPVAIEVLGESDPGTLSMMNNLAHLQGIAGQLTEELTLNEKVLGLRTRVLGERHPNTLTSMGNLAHSYASFGRHAEAMALNERVLALRSEILGERHPDTLFVMSNLGQSYLALGRHGDALALAERLLPLRVAVLGARHRDTLVTYNEIANLYALRGRHADAVALYERVLAAYRETLGEHVPDSLKGMGNLARALRALGRDAEALVLEERSLALQVSTLGEQHPESLRAMTALARGYRAEQRVGEALALLEKTVALQTGTLGERHRDRLVSATQLAQTYAAAGRTGEAVVLAARTVELQAEALGARHPDTLNGFAVLAELYVAAGRRGDAAALAERYVEGAEQQRGQPGLAAEDRRGIFQAYAQGYRRFSIDSGRFGELRRGFRLAELSKARTLLDSMTAQRAGRSGALPAAEQAALDELGRQVAAHEPLIAQARSAEARLALETARNALVREHGALEARLKARFPRYAQVREPRVLDAASLRGVVPVGAVAISYLTLADDHVAAWLVDAAGEPHFVDLGRLPHLADAVETLRRGSSAAAGLAAALAEDGQRAWRLADGSFRLLDAGTPVPDGAVAVSDVAEVAAWLGERLLAPLAASLRGRTTWIVSPDGPLSTLPFELLSFDRRRVLESVELHYAQSLSVYALARARQRDYRGLRRPLDLLALGDPHYDAPAQATGQRRRAGARAALPLVSEEQLRGTPFAWPALPGSAIEVQAIRRLLPRGDAYLQGDASEDRLQRLNRSGALTRYRILHFAVHGNLSSLDPALSSLVLSQRDLAPGTDGHVTAAEWPAYDLRSDLTVLSACDTGLGSNLSGEGVMGLPFALFLAGNVNTVLSLWPVLDDVAPIFMRRFYARIAAGEPAARALTKTKREMAADPRTRHPANWAPFILVGAG